MLLPDVLIHAGPVIEYLATKLAAELLPQMKSITMVLKSTEYIDKIRKSYVQKRQLVTNQTWSSVSLP